MKRPTAAGGILALLFALLVGDSTTAASVESPALTVYSAQVQHVGWMPSVEDGATAGKPASGLRVESLKLATSAGTTVWWRGHVQSVGWQSWRAAPPPLGGD